MPSDFAKNLIDHKRRVASYLQIIAHSLFGRAAVHDNSKFSPDEFDAYDQAFPNFQKYAFGSPELKAVYESIKPALQHHLAVNDHHPEYFENGINGMDLIQIIEMVCDWISASERSQKSIYEGLPIMKERFGIDDQLYGIIERTVVELKRSSE